MAHVAYAEYRVPQDVVALLAVAQQRTAAANVDERTAGTKLVSRNDFVIFIFFEYTTKI